MTFLKNVKESVKTKRKKIIAFIILAFIILLVGYMFLEPVLYRKNYSVIYSNDLPTAFDGTKIIFVADIHNGPFMNEARLNSLVASINNENPDIILLGGDYIKRDNSEYLGAVDFLQKLNAPGGIYLVAGNHDYYSGIEDFIYLIHGTDMKLLVNENIDIYRGADSITIIGTDDLEEGVLDLAASYAGVKQGDFAVLLSHNPRVLGNLNKNMLNSTDLGLFGHTHGGQITLFGLWSYFEPNYFAPYFRDSVRDFYGVPVIITNGFGTSVFPLRFFAPPEYHIITLKRSN